MLPREMIVDLASDLGIIGTMRKLVNGNTAFAIDLYRQIAQPGENLFFSPYSISIALAITFAGARGETERQMAEVMHFPSELQSIHDQFSELEVQLQQSQQAGQMVLRSANAIYPQKGYEILPSFLRIVKLQYGSAIEVMDYVSNSEGARTAINEWVEAQTENKIQNLIPSGTLNSLTRLILVNAIYFKGDWQHAFDADDTRVSKFWVSSDRSQDVQMMSQTDRFDYSETDQMQLLRLPYGDRFSMVVLLPKEGVLIEQLETMLSVENLRLWCDRMNWEEVAVNLPRFKLDCSCPLTTILQQLGMKDAFDDVAANFSGMTDPTDLSISQVLHKAFVEVNEVGTEAAAATAVMMLGRCLPTPPTPFMADRPFIFLIQEKMTGSILFMGKLANPIGDIG